LIIAFDTFILSEQHRRVGIYQYAKNLLLQFREMVDESCPASFRYFAAPRYSEEFLFEPDSSRFQRYTTGLLRSSRLWRLGLVNYVAAKSGADVVFCPAPKILPIGIPAVVTIHDVMPAKLPAEMLARRAAFELTMQSRVAAKRAEKIMTDSYYSKRDICELFAIPAEKIEVAYLGYNCEAFNSSPNDPHVVSTLKVKLGITRPYIIHHGMVQLRKNLVRLIHAYERLLERSRDFNVDLVLAGSIGVGSKSIMEAAQRIRNGKVIFTGPLSDNELGLLVKHASLSVIPSLYEGFCLPLVESMATGVPTIASSASCIPEISGGLLRYFDPLSEDQMTDNIVEVLQSQDLQCSLSMAGLRRSAEFSWQRCARETLAALID
jgi:glycosyltransferase involved in cell wall biosynthesis